MTALIAFANDLVSLAETFKTEWYSPAFAEFSLSSSDAEDRTIKSEFPKISFNSIRQVSKSFFQLSTSKRYNSGTANKCFSHIEDNFCKVFPLVKPMINESDDIN